MRKTPRFCKEPKTFSRDILLILNSFVSLPLSFSFALSCSRFFFLNCRFLPLLSHPLTRGRITLSHSRSLYVISICARSLRRNYLSCLLSAIEGKKSVILSTLKKDEQKYNYMYKKIVNDICKGTQIKNFITTFILHFFLFY